MSRAVFLISWNSFICFALADIDFCDVYVVMELYMEFEIFFFGFFESFVVEALTKLVVDIII